MTFSILEWLYHHIRGASLLKFCYITMLWMRNLLLNRMDKQRRYLSKCSIPTSSDGNRLCRHTRYLSHIDISLKYLFLQSSEIAFFQFFFFKIIAELRNNRISTYEIWCMMSNSVTVNRQKRKIPFFPVFGGRVPVDSLQSWDRATCRSLHPALLIRVLRRRAPPSSLIANANTCCVRKSEGHESPRCLLPDLPLSLP